MARANDLAITLKARDLMSPVIRGAKSTLDNFKRDAVTGFGLGAGMGFANLASDAFRGFINVMNDALKAARDLTEQQTKANYVFQDAANSVRIFAAGAADGFGMSERAALTALGTMGNLLTAIGQTPAEAAKMSLALTKLAADVSSFNNVASEEVLRAFQAALVGEAEPARRLGVNISMARVEVEALAMGLAKTKSQITDADKVTARYAIIMKDTANAQGDFARTSENLANQQRILDANLENLGATMGKFVEGPAVGFVQFLNGMLEGLQGPTGLNAEILALLHNLGAAPPRPSALEIYFADIAAAREKATGMYGDEAVTAGIINDADLMTFQRMGIEIGTITAIILRARDEVAKTVSLGPATALPKELYSGQARRDIYNLIADVTGLRYTLAGVGMPAPKPLIDDSDIRRAERAAALLKDDQGVSDRAKAMIQYNRDAKNATVVTGTFGQSLDHVIRQGERIARAGIMRGLTKDDAAFNEHEQRLRDIQRDTEKATILTGTFGQSIDHMISLGDKLSRARVMRGLTKDDAAFNEHEQRMRDIQRDTEKAIVVTGTFGTTVRNMFLARRQQLREDAKLASVVTSAFTGTQRSPLEQIKKDLERGSILTGTHGASYMAERGRIAAESWGGSFRDTLRANMDDIRDLADDIEWSLNNPRKGEQLETNLRRRIKGTFKMAREAQKIENDKQREQTIADIRELRRRLREQLSEIDDLDATVDIDTKVSGSATRILTGVVGGGRTTDTSKIRAHGGPAYTGETYLVGERGPELLVMGSTSGRVVPNDEIGGGNIVVNVDGERLFQVMNRRMGRSLAMGN